MPRLPCCRRFLQDRKLDVEEAEEKLIKMLRWRREFGCVGGQQAWVSMRQRLPVCLPCAIQEGGWVHATEACTLHHETLLKKVKDPKPMLVGQSLGLIVRSKASPSSRPDALRH